MQEIFKPVKGYEDKYLISNTGKVKSINFNNTNECKYLKLRNEKGYLYVELYKNSKKNKKYVHKLVAEAFIPNPNNLPQINHKDENKENNNTNNLEWCTAYYNSNYGNRNLKVSMNHIRRKVIQYSIDGNKINCFNSIQEASLKTKTCYSSIIRCCKGDYKQAGGYIWEYGDD